MKKMKTSITLVTLLVIIMLFSLIITLPSNDTDATDPIPDSTMIYVINIGETIDIGLNGTDDKSSDDNIATLSEGNLKGINSGIVSIQVTDSNGNIGNRLVYVTENKDNVPITHGGCGKTDNDNVSWAVIEENGTKTLMVAGNGETSNYDSMGAVPWNSIKGTITKLVISEGVTTLGERMFNGLGTTGTITIPDSVISIGNNCFNSNKMSKLVIGKSVTEIGLQLGLSSCPNIEKISVKEGNRTLASVEDYLYIIDGDSHEAFLWQSPTGKIQNYESIIIPKKISVGGSDYTVVGIGSKSSGTDSYAMAGAKHLTTLEIPETLKQIGTQSFVGINTLETIKVTDGKNLGSGTFDLSNITSMGNGVFSCTANNSNNNVQNVILNKDLKTIGQFTFRYCSSLSSITLPENLETIGRGAFIGTGFTEFEIPNSVTTLYCEAFMNCKELTSLSGGGNLSGTFGEKVSNTTGNVIAGCTNLREINIIGTDDLIFSTYSLVVSQNDTINKDGTLIDKTTRSEYTNLTTFSLMHGKIYNALSHNAIQGIEQQYQQDRFPNITNITLGNNVFSTDKWIEGGANKSAAYSEMTSIKNVKIVYLGIDENGEGSIDPTKYPYSFFESLNNISMTVEVWADLPEGSAIESFVDSFDTTIEIKENVTIDTDVILNPDDHIIIESEKTATIGHGFTITNSGGEISANTEGKGSLKCEITFNTGGGNNIDPMIIDYGSSVDITPIKNGHDFDGWYADESMTEEVDSIKGSWTLYAKWKTYTVSFSGDGVSIDAQTVNYGSQATKPDDPSRAGYDFVGWKLNGADYNFSSEVTSDIELVAEWRIRTYTVSFSGDGVSIDAQTVNYGSQATKPNNPTNKGYYFAGWFTDSEFMKEYEFDTPVTTNITVYAKWTKTYMGVDWSVTENNTLIIEPSKSPEGGYESGTMELIRGEDGKGELYQQYGWYEIRANIQKVIISDGVTKISQYAFIGFTSLKEITIPSTVNTLEKQAFHSCKDILTFNVSGDLLHFDNDNKILFYDDSLYYHPANHQLTEYVVPGDGSVTKISDLAFMFSTSLEKIHLSDKITSIGTHAFRGTPLNTITGLGAVESIGDSAFYLCTQLTSDSFEDESGTKMPNLETIGNNSFSGCTGLTSFIVPNEVTIIGNGAFENCSNITKISMGNKVTEIGNIAFHGCKRISEMNLSTALVKIGAGAFSGVGELTDNGVRFLAIPNNILTLEKNGSYSALVSLYVNVLTISSDLISMCDKHGLFDHVYSTIIINVESESISSDEITTINKLMNHDDVYNIYDYTVSLIINSDLTLNESIDMKGDSIIISGESSLTMIDGGKIVKDSGSNIDEGRIVGIKYQNEDGNIIYSGLSDAVTNTITAEITLLSNLNCIDGVRTLNILDNEFKIIHGKADEIPAVPAKIGQSGYTAGTKCSVCGEIIVAPVEVPAVLGGSASILTGPGVVTGGGNDETITVVFGDITLKWYPEEDSIGRYQDGCWAGFRITADNKMTLDAVKSARFCSDGSNNLGKSFYDCRDSGDDPTVYMGAWVPVSKAGIDAAKANGKTTLNWTYKFDWNGDGVVDQIFEVTVDITKVTLLDQYGNVYYTSGKFQEYGAKIGNKLYADFAAAADAAKSGDTIVLLKNSHCTTYPEGVTVNENGFELTHGTLDEIPGKAATCTEAGLTDGVKCSVCGEILTAQEEIPAKGHSYGSATYTWSANNSSCTASMTCSVCGDSQTETVKSVVETMDSTCSEVGSTTYTATFANTAFSKQTKVFEIAMKAHTEVIDAEVPPTCTTTGLTEGKHCSVCNTVIVAQTITEMIAHTEVSVPGKAATCTETGLTAGTKCSVCGEILVEQQTISMKAHTPVQTVEVPATCTKTGTEAYWTCSVCSKHFSDEGCTNEIIDLTAWKAGDGMIAKKAHTEETIPAVKATCTETGLTAGTKCSVCNEVLVEQEEIPALGHDWVVDKGKDATCTETGLTEGKHCSRCDAKMIQDIIPAKGHDMTYTAVFTETDNGYTAVIKATCKNDPKETFTDIQATVTSVTIPATCEKTGSIVYTASAEGIGSIENATVTVTLDKVDHTLVQTPYKAPTYNSTGNNEYWTCSVCGKVFKSDKTTETTVQAETIPKLTRPTTPDTPSPKPPVDPKPPVNPDPPVDPKPEEPVIPTLPDKEDGKHENADGSTTTITTDNDGNKTVVNEKPIENGKEKEEQRFDKEGNFQGSTTTTNTEQTKDNGDKVTTASVEVKNDIGSTTSKVTSTESVSEDGSIRTVTKTEEDGAGNTSSQTDTTITVSVDTVDGKVDDKKVQNALDQMNGSSTEDSAKTVTIITEENKGQVNTVTISPESMKAIADTGAQIRMGSQTMTVDLTDDVVTNLSGRNGDISLSIGYADKKQLNDNQLKKVGDNIVISVSATVGEESVHQLGGKVTVTLPYELKEGENPNSVKVYYVDDDGKETLMISKYDETTKTVSFETTHFSYYMVGGEPAEDVEDTDNTEGSGTDMTMIAGIAVAIIAIICVGAFVMYRRH